MKIVVTGSLGNIGKRLTQQLAKNGHQVIGIGRTTENIEEIEALGAAAAIGSVDDAIFLTKTFTGADAVFTMVPPNYTVPNSRDYYNLVGNSYAEAIKSSGVKRVVNVSSWGADLTEGTGFIIGAHDVENTLNAIPDLKITHLRCGYIYYNLYHFIDMIKKTGIVGSNYGGEDKIVIVDPRDIADAAFAEIESTASVGSKVKYVASDDCTANEIAHAIGEAIGKPDLKWLTFSNDEVRKAMESNGLPEDAISNTIALNESIHNGKMREDYDLQNSRPVGKVKLRDFVKDFAKVYNRQ